MGFGLGFSTRSSGGFRVLGFAGFSGVSVSDFKVQGFSLRGFGGFDHFGPRRLGFGLGLRVVAGVFQPRLSFHAVKSQDFQFQFPVVLSRFSLNPRPLDPKP